MAEYIERKVVINRIKEYTLDVYDIDLDDAKQFGGNSRIENYCEGLYEATELVDDIPAADVAPVRHARWVDNHCTACGMMPMGDEMWKHLDLEPPLFERFMDYCPNCGCRMDG